MENLKTVMDDSDKIISMLSDNFGSLDGIVPQHIFRIQKLLIQTTSCAIGLDDDEWLDWFIFENKWGEKGFDAGIDDDVRKIHSIEGFLSLIELLEEKK